MTTVKEEALIQAPGEGQATVYIAKPAALVTAPLLVTSAPLTKDKPAYEAFCLSNNAQRHLEIRQRFPAPAECPLNTLITSIRGEWRFGMAIDIMYGKNMLVEIRGKRLLPLFEALKEWKAVWIAEFDPQTFGPPLDDKASYIKSIIVLTQRPETPPPLSQRH